MLENSDKESRLKEKRTQEMNILSENISVRKAHDVKSYLERIHGKTFDRVEPRVKRLELVKTLRKLLKKPSVYLKFLVLELNA
jgi:hypothetical protein